ncbi:MAG TPA: RNA polymerase sigma factor region1.1 domain-containing protein, partial [Streptosporangiaceae bacterium]|nr:RNA polymerase sigma factor region1.1 domain-containing protein [Streptosporangiaceae bacterium]
MSPASSTSKPSELHARVIERLIDRGRTQGYLEADDVRRAFEDADIPVSEASNILRSLSKEGVTVMVSAADSAAPKRSRKRATPAARKAGVDAGAESRAETGHDPGSRAGGTGKSVSAAKEQPDTVTAVVDDGPAQGGAKSVKSKKKPVTAAKPAPRKPAGNESKNGEAATVEPKTAVPVVPPGMIADEEIEDADLDQDLSELEAPV